MATAPPRTAAGKNATYFNPSDRYPAGGLLATPTDLGRFGAALLAGELVGGDARAAMWAPRTTAGGEQTGYGLGWSLGQRADPEVFHGGNSVGATAYLYLRPHQRLVVAFATNLELWNQRRHELARRLADLADDAPAGGAP
jgi:serine beta-lactamase-like protein LACTB, mitochondrial